MSREKAEEAFRAERLQPHTWSNEPGYEYGEHEHEHHKVLYCIEGSITFHTLAGDVPLQPGQRIDLPSGTRHSATVGPQGVTCMEAARH